MCPHQNTPNEPDNNLFGDGDDHERGTVPLPRKAPDDDTGNLPNIALEQEVWCYDQDHAHGGSRRFSGHVNQVGGTEGQRLRGELAAVIRDLLKWSGERSHAEQHQANSESTEDGEVA